MEISIAGTTKPLKRIPRACLFDHTYNNFAYIYLEFSTMNFPVFTMPEVAYGYKSVSMSLGN